MAPIVGVTGARQVTRALAIAAVLVAGWGGVASATDVSRDQLATLARQAQHDRHALDELRAITSVDGQPVNMNAVIDGKGRADRLDELVGALATKRTTAESDAADRARAILADRRFHRRPPPRPFRGILHRVGQWLRPIGHALTPVFRPIGDALSTVPGAIAIGSGVLALALAATVSYTRRRARGAVEHARRSRRLAHRDDPAALERAATDAERAGDFDQAVRLRFRAGLLRLDDAGALALRPSLTADQAARLLAVPVLDELAGTFDEVAYGGRPATAADADASRTGWPSVLGSVQSSVARERTEAAR
jgi:hypothetical protein